MNQLERLQIENDTQLPSEFFLKNVSFFLLKWDSDNRIFNVFESIIFRDIKHLIPVFLEKYIPENKEQVFELFQIKNLKFEIKRDIVYDQPIFLEDDIEKFLLNPVKSLSGKSVDAHFKIIDLVSSFIKGFLLCRELKLSYSKNFLFIDLVFVKPKGFEEITTANSKNDKKLLIITGEPRSGKTYSAYYLLYKAFIDNVCRVFHCTNLIRFEQLLSDTKNYYKDDEVVIYYEDPFGYTSFFDQEIIPIISKLEESIQIKNLKVIITSRKQLLLSGTGDASNLLSQSIIVNYQSENHIAPELTAQNNLEYLPVYYERDKIKLIILKIAWLYKANWVEDYSNYYYNTNTNYIWNQFDYAKFSPGSIYESFLISSSLPAYTIAQIDRIEQSFLAGAIDLMKAFTSEVNTFIKRETVFYIKLFFVLPAITILNNIEAIKRILGDQYGNVIKHLDILKQQQASPFAQESLTYYHPMFGEAIDQYLFKYGYQEFLDDQELGNYLARVNTLPEAFIRDFICFLYYLDFVQNVSNTRQRKETRPVDIPLLIRNTINTIENDELRNEIDTIAFFYVAMTSNNLSYKDKKENIQSFLQRFIKNSQNPKLFPYIGSVLEHQLYFRLKNFKNDNLSETAGFFITAIANAVRVNKRKIELISSVFIHSIFSNLEYFLNYKSGMDESKVFEKDKIFSALTRTIDSIIKNYLNEEDPIVYIQTALIWLDAIMMKFSELHQFIIERKNLIEKASELDGLIAHQNNINTTSIRYEVEKCEILRDKLFEVYDDFWERINSKGIHKDYFRGAIAFSLIWHNRWNYGQGYGLFLRWIKKENISDPGSKFWEVAYRDGFLYNARYHYNYFLARNDAWTRESAIMIWKIDKPRKGANALYESGIIYWNGINTAIKISRTDELAVFTELIKIIFTKNIFDEVIPILYLVGLRYEKNQRYYEPLVKDIKERINLDSVDNLHENLRILKKNLTECKLNLFVKELEND